MAKEKTSFVLYHDIRKPLELLDDAQRGKLFMGILNYSEFGVDPDFEDSAVGMAFAFIKNALDRDAEAWADKRAKRAIAGSKGGKQTQANQANASAIKQAQANQAVPVPVPVPVNVPVTEKKENKEKRGKSSFVPPSLEEVRAYCKQRNSTVDPVAFYEYFTADPDRAWIDANGKRVTNWKQKLLTWEKFDRGKPQRNLKPNQIHGQAKTDIAPEKMRALVADLDRI